MKWKTSLSKLGQQLIQYQPINHFWLCYIRPTLRLILAIQRDIQSGQLTLRAMSLVYTTILSIVPLLALAFSVVKSMGFHNELVPLLSQFLAPLGEKGEEITQQVLGFVENINVGVLGAFGVAFLIYTVISLVYKVEATFNYIWRLPESRNFLERFTNYLSIIIVGPLLVVSAIGVTATITNSDIIQYVVQIEPFGTLLSTATKLSPFFLIICAFFLIYLLVPNTRVKWLPALMGAVVAGILWQILGFGFATFIASSKQYAAIYSSFAIIILLLIWIYLGWLIVILGADVAYYMQYPNMTLKDNSKHYSQQAKQHIAIAVMVMISDAFKKGNQGLSIEQLSKSLKVPELALQKIIKLLVDNQLLVCVKGEEERYMVAQALKEISLSQIVDCIYRNGRDYNIQPHDELTSSLSQVEQQISSAMKRILGDKTLDD